MRKNEISLKQINKFQFQINVKSKSSQEITFTKDIFLLFSIESIYPTISEDGLVFISINTSNTSNKELEKDELSIQKTITLPYNDSHIDTDETEDSALKLDLSHRTSVSVLKTKSAIKDKCFEGTLKNLMLSIDNIIEASKPLKGTFTSVSKLENYELYMGHEKKMSTGVEFPQAVFIKEDDNIFQVRVICN